MIDEAPPTALQAIITPSPPADLLIFATRSNKPPRRRREETFLPMNTYIRVMDELRCSNAVFNVGATLGVEVSINGPQGEDPGDGWAEIVLTNLAMMEIGDASGRKDRLVIKAGGGMETTLLANGLVWAGQELLRLADVGPVEPESLTS